MPASCKGGLGLFLHYTRFTRVWETLVIKNMKKQNYAIFAMSFLGLGVLTSCHDYDLGVSTQTLKDHASYDAEQGHS